VLNDGTIKNKGKTHLIRILLTAKVKIVFFEEDGRIYILPPRFNSGIIIQENYLQPIKVNLVLRHNFSEKHFNDPNRIQCNKRSNFQGNNNNKMEKFLRRMKLFEKTDELIEAANEELSLNIDLKYLQILRK
jgi:hypothetical protein